MSNTGGMESNVARTKLRNLLTLIGLNMMLLTFILLNSKLDIAVIWECLVRLLHALHIDKWVRFKIFKDSIIRVSKDKHEEDKNESQINPDSPNISDTEENIKKSDLKMKLTSCNIVDIVWKHYEDASKQWDATSFYQISPIMIILMAKTIIEDSSNTDVVTQRTIELCSKANYILDNPVLQGMAQYDKYSIQLYYEIIKIKNHFTLCELENLDKSLSINEFDIGSEMLENDPNYSFVHSMMGNDEDIQRISKNYFLSNSLGDETKMSIRDSSQQKVRILSCNFDLDLWP